MEISYHLRLADIIAFNVNHFSTNVKGFSKIKRNRILMPAIYLLVGVMIFLINRWFWPVSLFFISIAILWAKYYPEVCKIRIINRLKKDYKHVDFGSENYAYKLIIFPWGIEASNVSNSGNIFYEEIIDLQSTDSHVFLYLGAKSAIIIPKDSLNPENIWDEMKSNIKECYYVAKNKK